MTIARTWRTFGPLFHRFCLFSRPASRWSRRRRLHDLPRVMDDKGASVTLVWTQEDANLSKESSSLWRIFLQTHDSHNNPSVWKDCTALEADVVDEAWQLERQRRKVLHAQKAGQPVDELDIRYQDQDMLIVNKPGGVLTVPGLRQRPSLLDAVHTHALPSDQLDFATHRIVHRLDMDTSGLVLFGRSLESTKRLQNMFRQRRGIRKGYRAVVAGHFPVEAGTIDLSLQRDVEHSPFMRVSTPCYEERAKICLEKLHANGKKKQWTFLAAKTSLTKFSVVRKGWYTPGDKVATEEKRNDFSLPFTVMELEPVTGRTHQLRVHCAALGFPILGDPAYGWWGEAAPMGGLFGVTTTFRGPSTVIIQAWNKVHPPIHSPMCLHAELLELDLSSDRTTGGGRISCQVPAHFDCQFSFAG